MMIGRVVIRLCNCEVFVDEALWCSSTHHLALHKINTLCHWHLITLLIQTVLNQIFDLQMHLTEIMGILKCNALLLYLILIWHLPLAHLSQALQILITMMWYIMHRILLTNFSSTLIKNRVQQLLCSVLGHPPNRFTPVLPADVIADMQNPLKQKRFHKIYVTQAKILSAWKKSWKKSNRCQMQFTIEPIYMRHCYQPKTSPFVHKTTGVQRLFWSRQNFICTGRWFAIYYLYDLSYCNPLLCSQTVNTPGQFGAQHIKAVTL